jgi:hypothetical protein
MKPDIINGSFELFGGVTTFLNCWQLYRDKEVKGVRWELNFFYTAWGLWNLYYYPYLHQWFSFTGGILIVTGNAIWILQVLWYLRLRKSYEKKKTNTNHNSLPNS